MKIATVPKDYIINMSHEGFGKVESNFLLHGLCIQNDTDSPATITSIALDLYAGESFAKEIAYHGKALEQQIKTFSEHCDWLGTGDGAQLFLGEEGFFEPENYSRTETLNSKQQTGLFNEYVVVVHNEVLDRMEIKVTYLQDDQEMSQSISIPLVNYENKNEYTFPIKGCISTCGNYNSLLDHRQHYSMEFAIDMAKYDKDCKLKFKEDMKDEDYPVYGADVLAIADGVVVECFHEFPVTTSWDWEERRPYYETYGLASQFGNYVIIQHANEECSFYGHMIMNSLQVKVGDKVTQGQVIGKVGSTGLSNCPHIHFQLMDRPNVLTGRGLPCSFQNITDVNGEKMELIREENLIVHTI